MQREQRRTHTGNPKRVLTKHTAWWVSPFRGRWGGVAGRWENLSNCADGQRGQSILLYLPPPAGAQGRHLCPRPRSAFLFLLHSFQASAMSMHVAQREAGPRLPCAPWKYASFGRTACPPLLLVPLPVPGMGISKNKSFFQAQLPCPLLSKALSSSLRRSYLLPPVTPTALCMCCHGGNFHIAPRFPAIEVTC